MPKPGQIAHGETPQGQYWLWSGTNTTAAADGNCWVANGGRVMRPYYVAEIRDEHGKILHKAEPEVISQAVKRGNCGTAD